MGATANHTSKKVYHSLPYNVKYGSLLDGTSSISFGPVNSAQVTGGVLGTICAKLIIPHSTTANLNLGFAPEEDKYYFWSIHALYDWGDIEGRLHIPATGAQFGQVILKTSQWTCSYGLKKYTAGTTNTVHLSIANNSGSEIAIIYLADLQVVEFSNFSDAVAYAESRAFITNNINRITGPIHTSTAASANFRWIADESQFSIEDSFNIQSIEWMDTGEYYINFAIELEGNPVPQISFNALDGRPKVIGSFDDLSTTGMKVQLLDRSTGNPVDCSFSLTVD